MKTPTLAVVTFTRYQNPDYMEQMVQSVGKLPAGAVHHFIYCEPEDYERKRWECRELADYLCFVDDDDIVINDSINQCWNECLANPDVGVVFTAQQFVDAQGQIIPDEVIGSHGCAPVTYEDVVMHSQTLHHLAIIRTSSVHQGCLPMALRANSGIDWLMKGSAAVIEGALQLPIYGYQWRQHQHSQSKSREWLSTFRTHGFLMQQFLRACQLQTGLIPRIVYETNHTVPPLS
jgi:hypothetical protein